MKQRLKIPLVLLLTGMLSSYSAIAQTCQDSITPSTPDSRFTVNNDGTVTDNNTGLMWMRCNLGQSWDGTSCTGGVSRYSWLSALGRAEDSSFAGYNDWYLPNIKELTSIVEQACHSPAINETIFPSTASLDYWSSSPDATNSSYAWGVGFGSGSDSPYGKASSGHVRLVRAGL